MIIFIFFFIIFIIDHDHHAQDGEGNPISAMHDIPMLSGEGVYNMVVEVMMMVIYIIFVVMLIAVINFLSIIMIIPGAPMDKREDGD